MPHIIWDWNGTLLDDLDVVLRSVNTSLTEVGWSPITLDDYRTHYRRPVREFYAALAGRPVTETEWREIDERFHRAYRAALASVRLAADARQALDAHAASGASQSLLSMFPHEELVPLVTQHGLDRYFSRVEGLRGESGARKAESLAQHLRWIRSGATVLVGDTPDDLDAARANGIACVLYDGGGHHRHELEALGAPVASSLMEAWRLAATAVAR